MVPCTDEQHLIHNLTLVTIVRHGEINGRSPMLDLKPVAILSHSVNELSLRHLGAGRRPICVIVPMVQIS